MSLLLATGGGGGGSAYTLTGLAGSYSLTGSSASVSVGRKLTGNAGSYSLAGGSATLTKTTGVQAYSLTGLAGSYGLAGGSADLTLTVKAGGVGDYPRKKRFIVEKQGKLLVYSTADAAINAVDDKPEEVVPLAEVKKLVGKKQTSVIKHDLTALYAAYEAALDEQDIEDLLLLI